MPKRPILQTTIKKCRYCGEDKPLTEFYNSKNREKFGKKNMCKLCSREKQRKWIAAKEDKTKYYHSCHVKQYGISLKEYDKMLSAQNGVCAICGLSERKKMKAGKIYRLSVDHCHITDSVRALLCCNCNAILGLAHDDTSLLSKCINYLGGFK